MRKETLAFFNLRSHLTSCAEESQGNGAQPENGAKEMEKPKEEEKPKDPDQISIESAEDQEPVAAAAAIADSKVGNVQSPASVWLPYKDTNVSRNKVRHDHSSCLQFVTSCISALA